MANYLGKFDRFWDDTAKAPWLYDAQSKTMISYEDGQSLTAKTTYVREHGLGGIMIWELSLDDRSATLLTAVHNGLVQ